MAKACKCNLCEGGLPNAPVEEEEEEEDRFIPREFARFEPAMGSRGRQTEEKVELFRRWLDWHVEVREGYYRQNALLDTLFTWQPGPNNESLFFVYDSRE